MKNSCIIMITINLPWIVIARLVIISKPAPYLVQQVCLITRKLEDVTTHDMPQDDVRISVMELRDQGSTCLTVIGVYAILPPRFIHDCWRYECCVTSRYSPSKELVQIHTLYQGLPTILPCADKTLYFAKFSKCVFLYNPYLTNLFYLVSKDFS